MKRRTQEEIEALALEAAKRDLAKLFESGLPVTDELVRAMARQAAEKQAEEDVAAPDEQRETGQEQPPRSWLGRLFGR